MSKTQIFITKKETTSQPELYHVIFINPDKNWKDLMPQMRITCMHDKFLNRYVGLSPGGFPDKQFEERSNITDYIE